MLYICNSLRLKHTYRVCIGILYFLCFNEGMNYEVISQRLIRSNNNGSTSPMRELIITYILYN